MAVKALPGKDGEPIAIGVIRLPDGVIIKHAPIYAARDGFFTTLPDGTTCRWPRAQLQRAYPSVFGKAA